MAARSQQRELVGRAAELERLAAALADLESGGGGCVLIAGEPGIGKSSLARSLADRAAEASLPVAWGYAWEAGGAPAYWPWTQLFRSLLTFRDLEAVPALARIMPEWSRDADAAITLQPDQARFQLMEAARALLEAASRSGPLVLILEDLHAADTDSLVLLQYLAKHLRAMSILLVGTFRDMEARASAAASPLWQITRDADVIYPARLTSSEIVDYLKSRSGEEPDPAEVAHLLEVSEGNPLFLTELVGLLSQPHDSRLPDTIQQALSQQVERFPENTAEVLHTAAILGREFDVEELAHLVEADTDELLEMLEPALQGGMLESLDGSRLRFFHALCCEALLQDLELTTRQHLHLKHAGFLTRQMESVGADRATELAIHLSRAGSARRVEAVAAWRAAAARARERLAFDEVAEALREALNAYGEGPRFPPLDRCRLMLEAAAAEMASGEIDAGHDLCRDAYRFARTVRDPVLMAEAALTYGSAIVVASVDAELISALEETLAILPDHDKATRARVQARLAGALQPAPDPSEPVQMARDAITLARTTGDDAVIYEVLRSAVSALMDFAPASERIPLNEEFGRLAERFGDAPGQFRTTLRLIIDAAEMGDRDLFNRMVHRSEQIAEQIELPHYQRRVRSVQALKATIEGDYRNACRLLDEA
jgi:hypothetical protein